MMSWYLLQSGPGSPALNMALDEAMLEAMPRLGRPLLRFYSWTAPAASFGYFQRFAEVERLTTLRPLVRRPTGGGIVPHDADWTYSFAFPTTDAWYSLVAVESYRRVHQWLQSAFAKNNMATELAPCVRKAGPGQCFDGCEKSDLLCHGKKIAGAAQRRTRNGLLIQGSVQPPPRSPTRADWQKAMCTVVGAEQGIGWTEFVPDAPLNERSVTLVREKYSQPDYNQKR